MNIAMEPNVNYNGDVQSFVWSADFTRALLDWYAKDHRKLPWRETKDPWAILVSEIMCQQTRAEVAVGRYQQFLERFPTYSSLAQATEDEVVAAWSGLGYYSRARNLRLCAQRFEAEGGIPSERVALRRFPGIGQYTAGAVASIAFGQPSLSLDGNGLRVLSRFYSNFDLVKLQSLQQTLSAVVEPLIPAQEAGNFTNALIELGATVCKPSNPLCSDCPLRDSCRSRAGFTSSLSSAVAERPKTAGRAIDVYYRAEVWLNRELRRVALCRSHPLPFTRSMWLPKLTELTPAEATAQQAPGASSGDWTHTGMVKHSITFRRITIQVYVNLTEQVPVDPHWPMVWIDLRDLGSVPLPNLTTKVLRTLPLV
jgi:A/G-specific adenine glycosylase